MDRGRQRGEYMSDSPREIDFCVGSGVPMSREKWRSGDYYTTGWNLRYRDVEWGPRGGAEVQGEE